MPPPRSDVRVLSFHAEYGCRHAGRCCTSNWPIPVEPAQIARLREAIDAGRLQTVTPEAAALDLVDRDVTLGRDHGACVFHDAHAAGGCRIQRALGHAALPLACRQFPRQTVRDPRGVSVTLSHYCPTARGLLEHADGVVTIREHVPAFPASGEYVGLDANPDLPPLLHERCQLDWESWWLIEARAVALLTDDPALGLPRLALAIEHLRPWRPDGRQLPDVVHGAFDRAGIAQLDAWRPDDGRLVEDALRAVPEPWLADARAASRPGRPPAWPVIGRFLAAHAFASWAAYSGRGLRTWFRSIETAAALLWQTGDPGAADLVLRHLADSSALITRWNRAERAPAIRRP